VKRVVAVTLAAAAVVMIAISVQRSPSGGARRDIETADLLGGDPRLRAVALHQEGLDAFARRDERGMFRHMRAAWEADATYIPAIVDLLAYYNQHVRLPTDVRDALEALALDGASDASVCARHVLSEWDASRRTGPELEEATERARNGSCALFVQAKASGAMPAGEEIRLSEFLARRFPASLHLTETLLTRLAEAGAWDRILEIVEEWGRDDQHPILRAQSFGWRTVALIALRRAQDARTGEDEAEVFLSGSPPLLWITYLEALRVATRFVGTPPSEPLRTRRWDWLRASYALTRETDVNTGLSDRYGYALYLLDNGRLTESLVLWDELVAASDTFTVDFRSVVHGYRGRTLVKLGRLETAEPDLVAARALADRVGSVERATEAQHNLLHLYEALGRERDARQAGMAFVELTRIGRLQPVRMMAYYDMGRLLQRLGEYDAARSYFHAMLSAVDSLDGYHHWAGEYHEMIGDLDRAVEYYVRSWQADEPDAVRSLAALVRISEATGDTALAVRYARAHDARQRPNYPEFAPVLQGVLARAGEIERAAEALREARDRTSQYGQVAALSRLMLETAGLEYQRRAFGAAAAAADSAVFLAGKVANVAAGLRGQALAVLSRLHLQALDHETAVALLSQAAAEGARTREPQLEADLLVTLGDALVGAGRTGAAMDAYRRAADLEDSVATSLSADLVRAGFRAEQLRISNRALSAVLNDIERSDAPAWFAEWSVRRKARGIVPSGNDGGAAVVSQVRNRLGPDQALLDFVVLDSAVVVLVLTREASRIVTLPIDSGALRDRIGRLHQGVRPRVGSFVDLARASLDADVARRLYSDLLAPLEPFVGRYARWVIVPDVPLHVLPFDALIVSETDSTPVHVLDVHIVSRLPSLADGAASPAVLPAGPVLVVSPTDLAGEATLRPGNDIPSGSVGDGTVIRLSGSGATKTALVEQARNASIVHITAHAHPTPANPDFASVTLAPGDRDNGLLYAYEIRELGLPGSLVILEACETAGGRILGGEGPLSVSRAFLQAGASTVVGTLWPIGPYSEVLMAEFYRRLAQGEDAAAALRNAKLAYRATRPNAFHWAPFVLVSRSP